MYAFIRPSRIRNAALTEVPMIPPTVLKLNVSTVTSFNIKSKLTQPSIVIITSIVVAATAAAVSERFDCPR
jgi:hypothetical protein